MEGLAGHGEDNRRGKQHNIDYHTPGDPKGSADDGKRWDSLSPAMDVSLRRKNKIIEKVEGVWGRSGQLSDRIGGRRMTGSAGTL